MSFPGTGAVSLGPEAQDRHAFCPDSFLRVEHAPCLTHPTFLCSRQASVSLHREQVALVLPPAAMPARSGSPVRNRFQTRKPTTPALLLGQRAATSTDMLLGSAVIDVSLSLRFFPEAQPRFSLRPRGARAKRILLHAGIFHRAAETSSGKQQQQPRPKSHFPTNAVISQGR